MLSSNDRRKYATAVSRINIGVWGHPMGVFKKMVLTTREGDDQSVERFKADFRKLIEWMRGKGYAVEYCGIYERSPKRSLLHWHGLLRIRYGFLKLYDDAVASGKDDHKRRNRRALGDKWNAIHNAFVVYLDNLETYKRLRRYVMKDMLKSYLNTDTNIRNKFLVSKGWVPAGYKELVKDFKEWWCNAGGEVWMGRHGYDVLSDLVKDQCEHKRTVVKASFGHLIADSFVVSEAVIYEREVNDV